MFSSYRDNRTDQERYLEQELEDMRRREEERQEREQREREQRRKEQQEQWDYQDRQADSWPEAFVKQARLCWREHNQFPEQDAAITGDPFDDYFENMAQANEKALEIWKEVATSKADEIAKLQAQIEAVQDSIREEVADKLIAASNLNEYRMTAEIVRDNELDRYLDW